MEKSWGEAYSVDPDNRRNLNIIEAIKPQLDKLKNIYCNGQKNANLYGGATVVRLIDDNLEWDLPVNLRQVTQVEYSRICDYWEIAPHFLVKDFTNNVLTNYHDPEFYTYLLANNNSRYLHKSRVLRFRGAYLPNQLLISNNYWEDSKLRAFMTSFLRYNNGIGNVETIMDSVSIPIIKKQGLIAQLGKNLQSTIDKIKTQAVDILKTIGVSKGIMLDSEMDLTFRERNINGLEKAIETFIADMVANTDLTRPQLLGEHPSGMQSTGESEKRSEAETIKKLQEDSWGDLIRYDLQLLLAQYGIYDNRIQWRWLNAYQPDPLEEIEIELKKLDLEDRQNNVESTREKTNRE
jgi:phage-related protein (TIGR01555 family)